MITVIGKIIDPHNIVEVAQEVQTTFGKGGNPDATIIEDYIGYTNTPLSNGYFRATFDPAYATAMEYIESIGGAETVQMILVEWDGQTEFITDPETGEQLGFHNHIPMAPKPEPIIEEDQQ